MTYTGEKLGKTILVLLVLLISSPRILYSLCRYYLFRPILGQDDALLDISDHMRSWRGLSGMLARRQVLGIILGSSFGHHVTVYSSLFSKKGIYIGMNTYIGFDCNIGNVEIGKEVLVSDGVTIMSGGHQHGTGKQGQSYRYQQGENLLIKIGDGAWIGAGAIVMASVGAGAIVGAGSVVTKQVLENQVVAGVPARPIKYSVAVDNNCVR